MTHDDVQAWLERYVAAWESYDPAAIGDAVRGGRRVPLPPGRRARRGACRDRRLVGDAEGAASGRDEPGTYAARYEPYAVEGARAVAVGWSRYWTDASRATERATYDNCFLLEFDDDGRCRAFTEFFRERG